MSFKNPKNRGRGRDRKAKGLTPKQRAFAEAYIGERNGAAAARAAGYASADERAKDLLDRDKYPEVVAFIEARLRKIEQRAELKAADVLAYIHSGMLLEPLKFFRPSDDGGWLIDEAGLRSLPPEIGRLIEEVKHVKRSYVNGRTGEEETTESYWVRLVSKTALVALAAKHQLGEKINVMVTAVDWDSLVGAPKTTPADQIEDAIAGRLLPQPAGGGADGEDES